MPFLKLILFFGILISCQKNIVQPTGKPTTQTTIKVLYIGNSLTYSNALPKLVDELARQDNVEVLSKSIALPDYAFADHLADGKIQPEIANGQYDFVIGQQGPSALPQSQEILLRDAQTIAGLCKAAKTKLALYMVWPSASRSFDLDNVILSYGNAAKQTASILCPAGLAWKKAWENKPDLPLYSSDGFHPSPMGSVLAALTVYGAIKEKKDFDFIQYEACSWKKEVSKADFERLKQAALKALEK
jgi:hypothetical protein